MSMNVKFKKNGRILEVTLDRPKVNAIDIATSQELGQAFALLRDDPADADALPARPGGGTREVAHVCNPPLRKREQSKRALAR